MSTQRLSQIIAIAVLAGLMFSAAAQKINWHSIDGGGGISTGTDISITGVIGQIDTGRMVGGNLSLSGGYLPLPPDPELVFESGYE